MGKAQEGHFPDPFELLSFPIVCLSLGGLKRTLPVILEMKSLDFCTVIHGGLDWMFSWNVSED